MNSNLEVPRQCFLVGKSSPVTIVSVTRRRRCAFCPNGAATLTAEHLWSDWIGRLFTEKDYTFRRRDSNGKLIGNWRDSSIKTTAKVVCGECNGGWMSKVEDKAQNTMKEMIQIGTARSLATNDIAAIAAFGFAKSVIADRMYSKGVPFFDGPALNRFSASLEIPLGVQMWLASFKGIYTRSGVWTTTYYNPTLEPFRRGRYYVFTLGAGHLVLQVLGWKWRESEGTILPSPTFRQNQIWDRASIALWPTEGTSINWPPPEYLMDDSVREFADRWGIVDLVVPST
jgi:hypothetical protein